MVVNWARTVIFRIRNVVIKVRSNDVCFSHGTALRGWFVALALGAFSLSAVAGNVSRSEFNAFMDLATGAGKHTVGMGTNGAPLVTSGVPGAGAVGNMNISHTAGGWPGASGTASMPSPLSGKSVPLSVRQPLTKAATAKALSKFAQKAFWPLAAGVAVYDLIQELGYEVADNGDGSRRVFQTQTSYSCNVNYGPNPWASDSNVTATQYCVPAAAGSTQYRYGWSGQAGAYGWPGVTFPCGDYSCKTGYVENAGGQISGTQVTTEVPKTWEEFEGDIAAQSGWPSGSAISSALAQAVNGGEVVETEGPVVITSGGVAAVDQTNVLQSSDGSTVEDKTECSWAADLFGVVSWECVTVVKTTTPERTTTETVVTTKPDGTTETGVITKTTPATTTTQTTTGGVTDGKMDFDVPSGEGIPKSTRTLTYQEDDVGLGAGSCPDPIEFGTGRTFTFTLLCDKLVLAKPMIIAMASFTALLIIMGIKSEGGP